MLIVGDKRTRKLATCLEAAPSLQAGRGAAQALIAEQIDRLCTTWDEICEEAALDEVERKLLGQNVFLNPLIFEGAPERLRTRAKLG
ncbi:MAG: hypothetical protein P8014_20400 [Acidihalobacter sp.]|uniref:hypothetical protein n=1 Tax=Acidihalobacter sp. TaxID=1872108 RepID=UPI00307EFA8B